MPIATGSQALAADVNALKSTSGSYAGNDTENRAIPHGLSAAPKLVILTVTGSLYWYLIQIGQDIISYQNAAATGAYAVTAVSATDFYVGDAASYLNSANRTGDTYYWVAFP